MWRCQGLVAWSTGGAQAAVNQAPYQAAYQAPYQAPQLFAMPVTVMVGWRHKGRACALLFYSTHL